MHSLATALTRVTPSRTIWFRVSARGSSWVLPEIRLRSLELTISDSVRHCGEQSSPEAVLPSSHCSPASTLPLPHTAVGLRSTHGGAGAASGGAASGGAVSGGAASGGAACGRAA